MSNIGPLRRVLLLRVVDSTPLTSHAPDMTRGEGLSDGNPSTPDGLTAIWTPAPPWNLVLLGGRAVFYTPAALGGRISGPIRKSAHVPRFLWGANMAAVRGMSRILTRRQAPLWDRVPRCEESLEPAA